MGKADGPDRLQACIHFAEISGHSNFARNITSVVFTNSKSQSRSKVTVAVAFIISISHPRSKSTGKTKLILNLSKRGKRPSSVGCKGAFSAETRVLNCYTSNTAADTVAAAIDRAANKMFISAKTSLIGSLRHKHRGLGHDLISVLPDPSNACD